MDLLRQYILSLGMGITSIIVSVASVSVPYVSGMFTTIAIITLIHGVDGVWVMAHERKRDKI
jgi:hypothetical protein